MLMMRSQRVVAGSQRHRGKPTGNARSRKSGRRNFKPPYVANDTSGNRAGVAEGYASRV
jgi:hypothetical protein